MNKLKIEINFTKRYILALSLIAILSTLAYYNLSTLINKQAEDSSLLNISGKQRMLSQKIALFSIYYKTKALGEHLKIMQKAHTYLTSKTMSKELEEIYYSKETNLDKRVKDYISHADQFFKDRNGKSLSYILNNSQIILKYLDLAVSQYQLEAENRTKKLSRNELIILLLTIFILFIEAIFIFRPINRSMIKKTRELEKEIKFSNIITESNTNAIIAISEDLKVIIYNKSAENIFGFTKEEMLYKRSLHKIIADDYLHSHNIGIERFMKTKKFTLEDKSLELKAKRKNAEEFPIRISFGMNSSEDKIIVVANIQDISEEKFKDRQLLQQSRYAAMGEMIGNIAHQWRQPLSAISSISSGSVVSKEMNIITDKEMCENFDKIKEHTMYLSNTIDDFRNFFKTDDTIKEFELISSVKHAVSLTKALYKDHDINLFLDMQQESILYKGKASELSQVIMNILHNAKDILSEKDLTFKVVLLRVYEEDEKIFIKIMDNAGGIPRNLNMKIFEPYFTTKHKSKGTGIGLFMSKEIIEKHLGGTLRANNCSFTVSNKEEFGACFTCELPKYK